MIALAAVIVAVLAAACISVVRAVNDINTELRILTTRVAACRDALVGDSPMEFEKRFRDLEDDFERLPQKWEEFKGASVRAEGRARAMVKDVKRELDALGLEHAGIEEQGRELHPIDAAGGSEQGVLPLSDGLEPNQQPSEPDPVAELLALKFG